MTSWRGDVGARAAKKVLALLGDDYERTLNVTTVARLIGSHRETARGAIQKLLRDGRIERLGKLGIGGNIMYRLSRTPMPAQPTTQPVRVPGHPDAVWSGTMERFGEAFGLSSYKRRVG